jgi:ribonuclease HII
MVVGIDEAGRGPVIGPMIIAAVQADDSILEHKIPDSKQLSPEARWKILKEYLPLIKRAVVVIVSPQSIDAYTRKKQLNYLEYKIVKLLANMFDDFRIIVDFPEKREPEDRIVFEQKADSRYSVVALASILAKIFRDELIEHLKLRYGDFGSGYPSDPKTREFLESLNDYDLPILRKSWKTLKKLGYKVHDKVARLDEFFD